MRRERMRRTILKVVTFAAVAALAAQASAEIRVEARVHTPELSIYAGNAPSCYYGARPARRLPYRRAAYYEITRRDRKIAHRLAWYTGMPAKRLLRLRRRGYRWFEIGHWLYVPRPVVRAAMHRRSWNRFLREEHRHARMHGRRRYRVTYYDDYDERNFRQR
jgi:hypothetical protein